MTHATLAQNAEDGLAGLLGRAYPKLEHERPVLALCEAAPLSGGLEPLTFGFVIGVVVRIANVALHSTLAVRAIDCRR